MPSPLSHDDKIGGSDGIRTHDNPVDSRARLASTRHPRRVGAGSEIRTRVIGLEGRGTAAIPCPQKTGATGGR